MQKNIKVRYLPLFNDDLINIINYISNILKNDNAAIKLLDKIEKAINERVKIADSFATFKSKKKRENVYYKLTVDNYYLFYTIIEEEHTSIVEFRRIMYKKRNWQEMI